MGGIIRKDIVEEVRARSEISEVIGTRVALKRAGRSLKGICPFHKEKTPSFNVDPQRQIFHCFGCDKGGDVFRFIMEYDHVDFPTAVRLLADRAGVRIEYEAGSERPEGPDKSDLLKALEAVAAWYHDLYLNHPMAAEAREYVKRRALQPASVESFRIGYAPEERGLFTSWAASKKIDDALLLAAGILAKSDRNDQLYARFRDRLMFPICDEVGRVVGFSGRIMTPKAEAAKYVNSPETAVFRKSNILFALDRAKARMLETRTALLCEGQIDAIRCHEAGITNTVASQGTALTPTHARMIRRHADQVVLILDADAAGQAAAVRSAELFLEAGLAVRVAALPPGDDPDSLILRQGGQAMLQVVQEAKSVIGFQVRRLEDQGELADSAGRQRAARTLLQTIRHAESQVQRDALIEEAAQELNVLASTLRADLARIPGDYSLGRTTEVEAPPPQTKELPPDEWSLLDLLVHHPDTLDVVRTYLPPGHVTDPDGRRIVEACLALGPGGIDRLHEVLQEDAESCRNLAIRVSLSPSQVRGAEFPVLDAVHDTLLRLWRKHLEAERQEIQRRLRDAPEGERPRLRMESLQLTEDISRMREGWEAALPIMELSTPP